MGGIKDCIENWTACSEKITNKLLRVDDESLKEASQKRRQKAIDAQLKAERERMAQSADSARVARLQQGLDTGFLGIGSKLDVHD